MEEVQLETWAFGQQVEDVCRTAINRRYRLLPYVYTLFRETSQTGIPVMRPVFMADVNDETLRSEQQAFLLGGDLLIVPRWAEKPALPKGNWATFSMENGDDGYQARLALRPGSVLPLANLYQNTVDYCTDSLTLVVNLDEKGLAQGKLYEDDGDGFNYRSGDYSDYQLKASTDGKTLTVSLQKIDGKRKASNKRWLRIAQIVKGRLVYSNWQEGNQAVVKLRKK